MTEREIKHLKEDIIFKTELRGMPFAFHTTWGLFSPKEIDEGTLLLLKHINVTDAAKILDLGCGYGAIGLTLSRLAPHGKVHMVDKDFVAVGYSRKNAKANAINHCSIYLSNGFSHVESNGFDVIASNLPAKVGKEMFEIMLYDAKKRLKKNGSLYVVTISGLKEFIKRNFMEVFGNYEKLAQGKTYTVARAIKI